MIKVGITGQSGFIGKHLCFFLSLLESFKLIQFNRSFFENEELLYNFVNECDVIIHLAAQIKGTEKEIDEQNYSITKKLTSVLSKFSGKKIIYASSIQENNGTPYGRSKFNTRIELEKLKQNTVISLLIPNVYGLFTKPFYNSVIATFCYQAANNKEFVLNDDKELNLLHVEDLVRQIIDLIDLIECECSKTVIITSDYKIMVSGIIKLLEFYKNEYVVNGRIPVFNNKFEFVLFNIYLSYFVMRNYAQDKNCNNSRHQT